MYPLSPHAVLLAAGLGSRLLPLTADRPKCLIEVGGRTILDHQVSALRAAGIAGITIVGGYRFDRLAAYVAARWPDPGERPELVFNPFYAVSSSIGSVWAARHRLEGAFCLLNGDTIYDPGLVAAGLSRLRSGINLFVEPIGIAEPDDMLVQLHGDRVLAVAKDLPRSRAGHRSLGFIVADGADHGYGRALERVIAETGGAQAYHHAIVDRLAHEGRVLPVPFAGDAWAEIDRPEDIARWRGDRAPDRDDGAAAARRAAGAARS
ncbi:NTP transferase domain-containing protein [Sphingomonas morindae]|uniref:NTP transferase domain-containing protein n=1 Tax=Sphingomonas morindae TaxID=1541170 RepID=A0ABY4X895_9SPHN|nr:NTP transferase domain-containing protein [Sphingomonas morindae]USI73065.1 NTP transferase domain-containing protein [Sphingomonas morindae]